MNKKLFFTLGRIIDPKYLPNQLIILIVITAFFTCLSFHFVRGYMIVDSVIFGFFVVLITFFTWALAREMYPQSEYTALAAAVICVIALCCFSINPLIVLILMWFTLSLRLINQTTGLDASKVDMVMIYLFTLICAYLFSWIFLIFLFVLFSINYGLTRDKSDLFMLIPVMIAIGAFLFYQDIWYNNDRLSYEYGLFLAILLIVFILLMWFNRNILIMCDQSKKIVSSTRIFCAQILSIFFIFSYTLWFGNGSIILLVPIWCILIVAIIFSPFQIIHYKNKQ